MKYEHKQVIRAGYARWREEMEAKLGVEGFEQYLSERGKKGRKKSSSKGGFSDPEVASRAAKIRWQKGVDSEKTEPKHGKKEN